MAYQLSEHDNKFDRQLRLWGGHGQARLESSSLCVLHSGPTATELLKNLVLPNLGSFTLVDDAVVTAADVGSNFFLDAECIGSSRAEAVTRFMREMNADVRGTALHTNVEQLVRSNVDFFRPFHAVVACQVTRETLRTLAAFLFPLNIPLLALRTYGLLGVSRLQVKEHRIVESHPTNDRFDLYAHPTQLALWPELQAYVDSFILRDKPESMREEPVDDLTPVTTDTDAILAPTAEEKSASLHTNPTPSSSSPYLNGDGLDSEEHAHIPYLVLLAQCMRRYLLSHPSPPTSYDDKRAFKSLVISTSWDYANETNFSEAVDFAHRAYDRPQLDRLTEEVWGDAKAVDVRADADAYWVVVAALRRFREKEGQGYGVPVSQDIPDMHSKTEWYVQLKQLFRARSEKDTAAVIVHVHRILAELGMSEDPRLATSLSDASIAYMVKHCRSLRVVRTRSIEAELSDAGAASHTSLALSSLLEEAAYDALDAPPPPPDVYVPPNPALVHWYMGLRAVDEWRERRGRWPGLLREGEVEAVERRGEGGEGGEEGEGGMEEGVGGDAEWEVEGQEVVQVLKEVWARLGVEGEMDERCAVELVRAGACEPHVVAAVMGGVGSQEALKLLLQQYVPINHTLIFNGIHCSSQTWNL